VGSSTFLKKIGGLILLKRDRGFSLGTFTVVPQMFRLLTILLLVCVANAFGQEAATQTKPAVDQLIPWLLDEQSQLRGVPFSEVIVDVTGKKVVAFDPTNESDQRVAKAIGTACDETIKRFNAPDSTVQSVTRINEVSSHFEEMLRELLNATPGLNCDFPKTAGGKVQRSGYPDLRIVDLAGKRVYYLDPKLYAAGSRGSSFRTFYFEPKIATNKVREDAVHFIVGFEHEPQAVAASLSRGASDKDANTATERRGYNKSAIWKFTRWDIVDLSQFKVKLKAEFQGSNRDLYRPEAIVARSKRK
jgi:hypothetical protein